MELWKIYDNNMFMKNRWEFVRDDILENIKNNCDRDGE